MLCANEKSKIQALVCSQKVFPMWPGQPERPIHYYTRHGTTALFAALDKATGQVIGECYPQNRAQKFGQFLAMVEARVPRDGHASKNFTLHLSRR